MSNSLRIGKKALSLALAFIVVVGFMLVMNTGKAFADDPILLDSVEANVEVPEVGTIIHSPTQYTQTPELIPSSAEADPHYHWYTCYWATENGDPFDGIVEEGVPLYGVFNICSNYPDYYWKHDDAWKFSGTVTVNGGDATVISAVIPEYDGGNHYEEYLEVLVKFIPKEKERTAVNSVDVTADVPKCGEKIEKISTWEQSPDPNVKIVGAEPLYGPYGSYWSKDSDNWSWSNYYEGVADGETPLYLAMSFFIHDTVNYYWANEPDADSGDEAGGSYTGTVTVNGKKAEVIYAKTWENGKYVNLIVKLMPEHDWDDGKVTTEPTATTPGVMTYTCSGCEATKTEKIPATGGTTSFLLAQMTSKGSKALNIRWTKVNGAAGYDIFLSKCNKGKNVYKPQKVKTIKGAANTKWTKKGLKKKTAYKAYVKAYVMKDGKKTYVGTSPIIHAFTTNGNKYYTNAKSVTVKKSKVSLKAGKTFKIKASVKKAKSGKKLISKGHAAKLRYISSNVKVAKVNGAGNITAVAKGTCKVYAYSPNGVKKAVKVTVK